MLLLKNPSELQSPFYMFIYSHPFTCGVFMSISIAYPLCKYLSCVWGWKNLVKRGLLNRWTAWKIFLQPPHPSTIQLCANAGDDSWIQAVFFDISTTHWEAKLHFGFSLDSDGWLTAGFSFSGCCRLCDSDCTSSSGVCWYYYLKSGNNRLREDRVMRHHSFELVCSKYAAYKKCDPNQELGVHLTVRYPFLPLDGNVSLDRNPWDRRFLTSLLLLFSSLFFSISHSIFQEMIQH